VAVFVRLSGEAAGLEPAGYAGHGLRAGFATSAAAAGVEALARQHRPEFILAVIHV